MENSENKSTLFYRKMFWVIHLHEPKMVKSCSVNALEVDLLKCDVVVETPWYEIIFTRLYNYQMSQQKC